MPPDPSWATPEPVSRLAAELPGRVLLDQHWRDLSFLHWRVSPDTVAPLLPPGTRPDVFDGSTWVGLIPFRLTDAAFGHGPPLPYVGSFPETNVRLYSVDAAGRRGVVFRSLESARLAFVLGARVALGLNYTWAKMSIDHTPPGDAPAKPGQDGWAAPEPGQVITYSSRRRWPQPRGVHSRAVVRVGAAEIRDDPLADFLTARWGLHTRRLGRTLYLRNTHGPWPLVSAELLELDDQLLATAGLPGLAGRAPDSVMFSPGVRTVFGGPVVSRPPSSASAGG